MIEAMGATDGSGSRDSRYRERLRLGVEFGKRIAHEYELAVSDLEVCVEVHVDAGPGTARYDDDGRRVDKRANEPWGKGIIDILLKGRDPANGKTFHVVIEVKNTDWDERASRRVLPNLNRHRLQVWRYLEPMVERVDAGEYAWVQGALIYPRRPTTPGRADEIDAVLEPWGVTVAYAEELSSQT